jgi:hypothetical protein
MRLKPEKKFSEFVLIYVPVVSVIPLLTVELPVTHHQAREIAGYYQSLGLIRLGIESFFIQTPSESFSSGLHLHSVFSSAFLSLGYYEGGRLVSLVFAIVAVTAVAYISVQFVGIRVALLAPLFLWAHPFFLRSAYLYRRCSDKDKE